MHNRTLLLLFLLSFCRLSAQVDERPYTLRSAELSGPVQTVFDSSYTVRRDTTGSVVGKSRLQRYRYDYGKDGNLQHTQLFSFPGNAERLVGLRLHVRRSGELDHAWDHDRRRRNTLCETTHLLLLIFRRIQWNNRKLKSNGLHVVSNGRFEASRFF